MISRRGFLGAGLAAAGGVAAVPLLGSAPAAAAPAVAKVRDLTGLSLTSRFGAGLTDLGIPARCPNGSLFYACGDTFDGDGVGQGTWVAPVGLRSSSANLDSLVIDGAVGGSHARSLVGEGHVPVSGGSTTAIPSDCFTIGNTMYLHLMRGLIYQTDHSDFWRSTDNGETWTYLCQWPGSQYGGQFQQKTYAVGSDGYCYVLSSVFNRDRDSGLLLFRVRQDSLGTPSAYQPWGYANGWAWGNPPTTISPTKRWGEICFREIGGKYVLTWFDPASGGIQSQVLGSPTANVFTTPKQQLIYPAAPDTQGGNRVAANYGGFIFPGSTLSRLDMAVSQWFGGLGSQDYRVMQYRVTGLA